MIKECLYVSSTMSPGVKVNDAAFMQEVK